MTEEQPTKTDRELIEDLVKQCHFFHMEVERMEHLYVRVQQQELRLYKLEHHDD